MHPKKFDQVVALAESGSVELMTHPIVSAEKAFLMSDEFQVILQQLEYWRLCVGLILPFALLLSFKDGNPEAIQEFVVRESSRNQHCYLHVCGGAHGFYDTGELIRKHRPDVSFD